MTLSNREQKEINTPIVNLEAIRLIYNFKKNYIEGTTYAVHFTKSDLEELLKQLNDAQEPGKLGNGVTFYFGEYPENFSPNLNNALYGNCRTLVAIPTYGSELNGSYTDFMNADTVAALKKIIDDGGIKENMPQDGTFSAFNHYKLCPPENNCSTSNVIWENLK